VFELLDTQGIDWMVYSANPVSLVQALFVKQWLNAGNFGGLTDFLDACQSGSLPPFTFVEPPFGIEGVTDASYHPPYDVTNGEQFLSTVVQAIQGSPDPDGILLVVLFDEHGGTYDHVEPPMGAQPPYPDPVATDGSGFTFDQFGVRVPAILVSPYVTPGTVFRSPTDVPFDHTSMLATLRDWLGLQVAFANVLPSPRIAAAPTFTSVIGSTLAASSPPAAAPLPLDASIPLPPDDTPLDWIQRVLAVAAAAKAAGRTLTPEQWSLAMQGLKTVADLKAFEGR
jgi:phospholipase C